MKIGPNLAGRRVALQRVSVTRSGEDFPDGEGVVSMFFSIRYQTVVAEQEADQLRAPVVQQGHSGAHDGE
jgi:hypothetical protein